MNINELKAALDNHLAWICCKPNGVRANLSKADLRWADLRLANLSKADLSGAKEIENARNLFHPIYCPEKGSYIGFKKCMGNLIVKLEIPSDALRSSATSRKCRADKAFVVSVTDIAGKPVDTIAHSIYDHDFTYEVGKAVSVEDFDTNRWNECSSGIHHYITREEAVRHI